MAFNLGGWFIVLGCSFILSTAGKIARLIATEHEIIKTNDGDHYRAFSEGVGSIVSVRTRCKDVIDG